jgi:polysaccharide pyruvyl transferase WcaK-like protein
MTEPSDPFDEDEMQDIVRQVDADRVYGAIDEAQEEIGNAVTAIEVLVARLHQLIPAAAIVSLITSMAVGTAIEGTYGDRP